MIELPQDVPSAGIQIAYEMIGSFGAAIMPYSDVRVNGRSIPITASMNGAIASRVRAIVYVRGCDIQTFDFPVNRLSKLTGQFRCVSVPMVKLAGQIDPLVLRRAGKPVIVVNYSALWAYGFLNYTDGATTEFELASVTPNRYGAFQVELPLFKVDATVKSPGASFWLAVEDQSTGNGVSANLEPASPRYRSEEHQLRIESSYPGVIYFISEPR
ncbi:MAG: hypothetical protein ACRD5K_14400 [Candidatus Acidiferrales bacterium]